MSSSFRQCSFSLWHDEVNASLRFLERELDRHSQWLPFRYESLLVGLAGNPDIELAAIEVRVDQVAAGQMSLGVRVEVQLVVSLTHLQGRVEILKWGLHRLVETNAIYATLLRVETNMAEVVTCGEECQLHISKVIWNETRI